MLRDSSGLSHLQILDGRMKGKESGLSNKIWVKDICKWTGLGTYDKVKGAAEDRKRWKLIVVNLRIGVDK